MIKPILYYRPIRATIQNWPGFQAFYGYGRGWDLLHPFDRLHGTDTSGFISWDEPPSRSDESSRTLIYGGSQPSIIRSALATLPSLESFTFVDLGCGKGRPLFVATEFPFRAIVGVELYPSLAAEARANAKIFRRRYPARVPVRIELGDAGTFPFPAGNLVVYLYNPFGKEVILKVVARIEAALAAENRSLYVVYYNPIYGDCFDASRVLIRYFAATLPYPHDERGYGPHSGDTVVIWSAGGSAPALSGADARIEVTTNGFTTLAV